MPDGDQFGNPDLVLGQDRLQRVVPALLFCPVPERAPPGPFPGSLPRCPPLAARCRQIMQRSRRRRWSRRTGLRHEAFLRCGRHGYRRISYRRQPAVHMLPGSHPGHTTAGDSSRSPDPDDQYARTRTCGWSACRADSIGSSRTYRYCSHRVIGARSQGSTHSRRSVLERCLRSGLLKARRTVLFCRVGIFWRMRGEVQQRGTEVPGHGEYDSGLRDRPSEIDRCRTLAPYSRAEHTLASLTFERGAAQASTRRSLKPPGLGGAVFPELPVAVLCAILALPGGIRDRARRPSRVPSARWLRTLGSFRVGRAVATMMV